MPYKDKEKQRQYQREWQRMKKAGKSGKPSIRTLNPEDIRNAKGLRDLMAEVIMEIKGLEADPLIRARCIGYLVSIALRTVETADLEERILQLEEDMERKGDRDH